MKMTLANMTFALALLLGGMNSVQAHSVVYTTNLSGDIEVPVNDSLGTGSSILTIDVDLMTMRIQATFSGLTGTTTLAHIHCCVANGFDATQTAGVATPVPTFPGFPAGVSAGSYDQTFNLALASSWNPSFVTAVGGIPSAFSALLSALDSGKAYLNIHTSFRSGGEIRGFYAPAPVPLPPAALLLGSALAGLAVARRRRAGNGHG